MRAKLTAEERLDHQRESVRKWNHAHREKCREAERRYYKAHPERRREAVSRWQSAHRKERNAEQRARGKIPLFDACELCGAEAKHRHHLDYSQPMLVVHVCAGCHRKIHARKQKLSPDA